MRYLSDGNGESGDRMKPQPTPKPRDIPVLRWLAGDKSLVEFLKEMDS